jgi:hypothetical protein
MAAEPLLAAKRATENSETTARRLKHSHPDRSDDRNSFDAEEEQTVRTAYETEATLNEVGSLLAYQARGHRFQRIADRLEPEDKLVDSLRARADLVMAEVQAVQIRVGL